MLPAEVEVTHFYGTVGNTGTILINESYEELMESFYKKTDKIHFALT
jgi:hypothetical protein